MAKRVFLRLGAGIWHRLSLHRLQETGSQNALKQPHNYDSEFAQTFEMRYDTLAIAVSLEKSMDRNPAI
jgi:hypothetical protein